MQSPINVRVPDELKIEAANVLRDMGLSPSSAVRLFLAQVVKQKRIPFEILSGVENEIDVQPEREVGKR